jgi:hypothetical protein
MTDDGMDKITKSFGVMALAIGGTFFFIIMSTFLGGLAGWTVGLIFGETILGIFAQIGIKGATMFQIGCFLGFVGGFLKTKVSK